MDNDNKNEQHHTPGKKEMRKQLADKITAAIPELIPTLGERKFQHRIKKAVKLLTEGLHKKETTKAIKKIKAAKTSAPGKKVAAKKAIKKRSL